MNRQKIRIRFRKEGDLRLISHRDLARALERLFRRAELPLAMSEGFHPHPRITFPSALALGIQGDREVIDVILQSDRIDGPSIHRQLSEAAPPGLVITEVTVLKPDHPKPRIDFVTYEIPVPVDRHQPLQTAIDRLLQQETLTVDRAGKAISFCLSANLEELSLHGDRLTMRLTQPAGVNLSPREVLQAVGLDDLEQQGYWITRTDVQLVGADSAVGERSR